MGAGDAPSQPGAMDTTGGSAEGRALSVIMGLGGAASNYTPDAAADQEANQIIAYGQLLQSTRTAVSGIQLEQAPINEELTPPCQEDQVKCQ